MRNAFADELLKVSRENENIIMLSADIGNRLFDNFKQEFPDRFYNCGVAEANTIGVAAGLSLSGFHPIAYTITPFITFRCTEQIKIDLCYHNLPSIVVGVGAGLSYSSLGSTHHSCEDVGVLKNFPNLTIICPGDANEVRASLRAALKHNGPVYIRLGKKGEPIVHQTIPDFSIGKGIVLREGEDVCILSTGTILPTSVEVAKKLEEQNITSKLVSLHTIKPLDGELLAQIVKKFKLIVTLEEHSLIGGLGSSIAEWMMDHDSTSQIKLLRFGTPDEFPKTVMSKEKAHDCFGLTPEAITKRIRSWLEDKHEN
jgi:transketolase